jgi:Peptidase inhibitor I78 family
MRVKFLVAVLALGLAACAEQPQTYRDLDRLGQDYQRPPQNAEEATRSDTCGAGRFRNLIGEEIAGIDPGTLPAYSRVIRPDTMVTQDFSPTRLNIMVGTDGRIGSLRCF